MNPIIVPYMLDLLTSSSGKRLMQYFKKEGAGILTDPAKRDSIRGIMEAYLPIKNKKPIAGITDDDVDQFLDLVNAYDENPQTFEEWVDIENKKRAQQKTWNKEDADYVRDMVLSVDPKTLAIRIAADAAAKGLDVWANDDKIRGNALAAALMAGSRQQTDAQAAKYGPSPIEQGMQMYATKRNMDFDRSANIKSGLSDLIKTVVGRESRRADMANEMAAAQRNGNIAASYWQYRNGRESRQNHGGGW